jgi:hypothetical protein
MAVLIDLADAVVAELNTASFSQALTAQRHYQPRFDLSEMAGLHVSVVPKGLVRKALDRGRAGFEYLRSQQAQREATLAFRPSPPHLGGR